MISHRRSIVGIVLLVLLLTGSLVVVQAAKENFDRSKPHVNIGSIIVEQGGKSLNTDGFEVVTSLTVCRDFGGDDNNAVERTAWSDITLKRGYGSSAASIDGMDLFDGRWAYDFENESFFDVKEWAANETSKVVSPAEVIFDLEVAGATKPIPLLKCDCLPKKWEMIVDNVGDVDGEECTVECSCSHL